MADFDDDGAPPDGFRLLVRIWLPDRPGALGLVASRIGALGADIIAIDVLERGERIAVDEFSVVLPSADLVNLLVREIEEVDGASVEDWRPVERFPDPRLDALTSVEQVCAAGGADAVLQALAASVAGEFDAHWVALLRDSEVVVTSGDTPDPSVLAALATGTTASPAVAAGDAGPADLAVAPLPGCGALLLAGREGHAFRRRERHQLRALARIADRIAGSQH
jgi:hypothetical protein